MRTAVLRVIPQIAEFSVSIMPNSDGTDNAKGFLDLLRWVLSIRRPTVRLPEPACDNPDPVFGFAER